MKKNKIFEKQCAYCGKVFHTDRYPTECCCDSCYFKLKRRRQNQLKLRKLKVLNPHLQVHMHGDEIMYVKKCELCGKVFETPFPKQIFCSSSCNHRFQNLKKRYDVDDSNYLPVENFVPPLKFLRMTAACRYMSVTKNTLYRWAEKGYLNMHYAGTNIYFKVSELDNVFDVRRNPSVCSDTAEKLVSIAEISDIYGLDEIQVHSYLHEGKIPFVQSRNMRLYPKYEVMDYFSSQNLYKKEPGTDGCTWLSVEELSEQYGCNRNFIYHFTQSRNLPKKKVGRFVLFSAEHFDRAMNNLARTKKTNL